MHHRTAASAGRSLVPVLMAAVVLGVACSLMILTGLELERAPGTPPAPHPDTESAPPSPEAQPPAPGPRPSTPQALGDDQGTELPHDEVVYFRLILIAHVGVPQVPPDITRTREEALALAARIRAELVADPTRSFAEAARQYSDDPTRERGGALPRLTLGQIPRQLALALHDLAIGEISEPVDHERGVYLFQRLELPPEMASQHLLVSYKGAHQASPSITRTQAEARARAEEALRRALAGEDFEALIREYSDHPNRENRGLMGIWTADRVQPEYAAAAAGVPEWGIVPEVVEVPQGYYVIRRLPLEETEPPVPPDEPIPEPTTDLDPARVPPDEPPAGLGRRACGYEILITWQGAQRANRRVTRTEAEALARAQALVRLARSEGTEFPELVPRYTEARGAESTRGSLGLLRREHAFLPEQKELFRLAPGTVSDPVRTDTGYHIVCRVPIEEVALRDIVVTYAGARHAARTLERTREEALARIEEARDRILAGEEFATVARQLSDQRARNGGGLGVLYRGHPYFVQYPEYEQRAFALKISGLSDIFETPMGFHLITRTEPLRARHILVSFRGKVGARGEAAARDREAAMARAQEVLRLIRDEGKSLEELVADYSDDPRRADHGDTGVFGPGRRVEEFCRAVEALEIGEVSEPVETRWGFHIIERLPLVLPGE